MSTNARECVQYVEELQTYIERNAGFLVNHGECYHAGERISTAFTEAAVNYVVDKHDGIARASTAEIPEFDQYAYR